VVSNWLFTLTQYLYILSYNVLMSAVDCRLYARICSMGQRRLLCEDEDESITKKQRVTELLLNEEPWIVQTKKLFEKVILLETSQILLLVLIRAHD
jgi:hypothetical protein